MLLAIRRMAMLVFGFLLFYPLAAFAQMDSDFSLGGAIRVGASTTTCNAAATGGIRYESGFIQWCNGTSWQNIGTGGGGDSIDSLTDAFTDYATNHNFTMGRTSAAALTAGAQFNTFIGESAGATTTNSTATTDRNTAVGYQALTALTSGYKNTGTGYSALIDNTTGSNNTADGNDALSANTTGSFNTSIGSGSLYFNTTGNENVAVGDAALQETTTGSFNTAVGRRALDYNKAKSESTAVGYSSMYYADDTATGSVTYNTAVGAYALRGSATAANNTGIGNTALGHSAMISSTSGSANTALGLSALYSNTTGGDSVAVGKNALTAATTGGTNTALGSLAGDSITTGAGNIVIGYNVDTPTAGTSNHMNIGNTIYADLSTDKVGIGKAAPTVALDVVGDINYTGVTTDVSDRRQKDNIKPLTDALEKVTSLQGVSFTMKNDPKKDIELGVIAQDVEPFFPELVRTQNNGVKSMNYIGLIAPMIEAIKTQQHQIDDLKASNDRLQKQIEEITANGGKLKPSSIVVPYNN